MLGAKPALSCLCLFRLAFDLKITSKARNSVFLLIENSASPAAVVDCFIGICLSACKWTDIISPGAGVKGTIWRTWPVPCPWRDILTSSAFLQRRVGLSPFNYGNRKQESGKVVAADVFLLSSPPKRFLPLFDARFRQWWYYAGVRALPMAACEWLTNYNPIFNPAP